MVLYFFFMKRNLIKLPVWHFRIIANIPQMRLLFFHSWNIQDQICQSNFFFLLIYNVNSWIKQLPQSMYWKIMCWWLQHCATVESNMWVIRGLPKKLLSWKLLSNWLQHPGPPPSLKKKKKKGRVLIHWLPPPFLRPIHTF